MVRASTSGSTRMVSGRYSARRLTAFSSTCACGISPRASSACCATKKAAHSPRRTESRGNSSKGSVSTYVFFLWSKLIGAPNARSHSMSLWIVRWETSNFSAADRAVNGCFALRKDNTWRIRHICGPPGVERFFSDSFIGQSDDYCECITGYKMFLSQT